ncbi:recombinase family protein [Verrucomicrobiales bacterium BCK34]|nr:recombinase family protein [Verrucomicrobiales bacterium BCK34]
MPKVYSYLRFSSPEQAKGDSKRRQTKAVEEYAENHGLEVDTTLEPDEGISAFDGSNVLKGHLGEFLSLLKTGKIDEGSVLLVESLDRISRQDILGSLEIFTTIIRNGVKIVTLADNREYDQDSITKSPFDLFASLLILQRANEESKLKSKRIAAAWEEKRRNIGKKKLSAMCPEWLTLDRQSNEFKIISERAALVQRIFEESRNGIGQGSIAKRLNKEGIEPWGRGKRKGRSWHTSTIQKILRNIAVLGHYQPHRMVGGKRVPTGVTVEDYFPNIIEETLFYEVQELRRRRRLPSQKGENRNRAANRNNNLSNLFTGLVTCGFCGSSMRYVSKGSDPVKSGKYLVCNSAMEGKGCRYVATRYEAFEKNFIRSVRNADLGAFLDDAKQNEEQNRLEHEKIALQGQITDIDAQTKRLTDALALSTADSPKSVVERIVDLESQKRGAEAELKVIFGQSAEGSESHQKTEDLKAMLKSIEISLHTLEGADLFDFRSKLREALLRLITEITIFPRNREIHLQQLAALEHESKKSEEGAGADFLSLRLALLQEHRIWPKSTLDRPMLFEVMARTGQNPLFVSAYGNTTRISKTPTSIRDRILNIGG